MIAPAEGDGNGDGRPATATAPPVEDTWAPVLAEVATLQGLAHERLAPGSDDPGVVRQRSRGKLTCRERIDLLLDPGSFREVGSLAGFASYDADGAVAAFTPANHVGGWGAVDARTVVVCADDFTSRGGHADGAIGAKSFYLDQLSMQLQVPSVRLLDGSSGGGSVAAMVPEQRKEGESTAKESSGAIQAGRPRVTGGGGSFLPGHLGSTEYTAAAVDRARGERPARQRGRHRRGQGRARPLRRHGARHRPAVRGRAAGRVPRHGLRHQQGGPRRLAHPLPQRLGRQPGRDGGGGDGDDAPLPLLPARRASTRPRPSSRPIRATRPTVATRSCSRSSRASGRPRSTSGGPSS